ncbi:hypothetical protein TUMEXPCC7403_03410 [Tumidithrix helvetica PCC 7403]|uniref:methyl-accepting chemotaxis protein n=1 Tax=Tumidithrix helvetica TaxID=3457545 RepID=UPI003C83099D
MALTTNQPSQSESSKLSSKKSKKAIEHSPTKQKRSRGTIGTTLLVLVLGSAILGLGTSGYLYYRELTSATQRQIEKNLSLQVSEIEGKLSPTRQSALDLAASVKALHGMGIKDPEIYKKMVFEHFKRLDFAISLGVGQAPNTLVADRKWYYPSFYRELPGVKADLKTGQRLPAPNADTIYSELFESDNYPDKKYWREPTAIEEGLWLEPYEASNGLTLTSYVAPFYSDSKQLDNRKLLGVTSADVSIVTLTQKVSSNVLGNAGTFIVLSPAGNLLSYPPDVNKAKARESYLTVPELKAIWTQIQGKTAGIIQIDGKYYAYRQIRDIKWWVLAVLPESYVLEQVLPIAVGTTVGVGSVLILIVIWFVWSLNRRLRPILNECDKLAEEKGGELLLPRGKDEIDRLDASFNNMLAQIANSEERIKREVTLAVKEQERLNVIKLAERESEILEGEVGSLLDVVSSLEEGDLTVEAEVSDRATGLVADTLNRLRERLSEIIASVLGTAQRVASGAEDLEKLARTVAENTVNQAQSVAEGRALTEQVALSAQNSASQVQIANQALQDVQNTVAAGQVAINQLTAGITVLQKGSAQIVQRMKTLGEFVGLAEQFVQDQSQIASLTQVLAINATLVAARAAEQKDPKQFTGVAREFEAIAGQVNDLATQTSDGLTVLRQRTSQIQSVVSAVDAEVQNLGGLVAGFTSGVEQSQLAFNSVQTTTTEVVEVGQRVTESSLEIALASDSTAKYMSEIATLAQRTADLTGSARQQAEQMGSLAQHLLEGIRFFRLPDTLPASPESDSLAIANGASDLSTSVPLAFRAEPEAELEAEEPQTQPEVESKIEPEAKTESEIEPELEPDDIPIATQDDREEFSANSLLDTEVQASPQISPVLPLVVPAAIATGLSMVTGDTTTPQFELTSNSESALNLTLGQDITDLEVDEELLAITDTYDSNEFLQSQLVEDSTPVNTEVNAEVSPEINPVANLEIQAESDPEIVSEIIPSDAIEPLVEIPTANISTANTIENIPTENVEKVEPPISEENLPKRSILEDDFRGFNLLKPIILSRVPGSKAPQNTPKNDPKNDIVEPNLLASNPESVLKPLESTVRESSSLESKVSVPDISEGNVSEESFNLEISPNEELEDIEIDASYLDAMTDLDINERFDAMMLDLEMTETPPDATQVEDLMDEDPMGEVPSEPLSLTLGDPFVSLIPAVSHTSDVDSDSDASPMEIPDLEVQALVETLANDLEEGQVNYQFEPASDFEDDIFDANIDNIFAISSDLDLEILEDTPDLEAETPSDPFVGDLENDVLEEENNISDAFSASSDFLPPVLPLEATVSDPFVDRQAFEQELTDSLALLRQLDAEFDAPSPDSGLDSEQSDRSDINTPETVNLEDLDIIADLHSSTHDSDVRDLEVEENEDNENLPISVPEELLDTSSTESSPFSILLDDEFSSEIVNAETEIDEIFELSIETDRALELEAEAIPEFVAEIAELEDTDAIDGVQEESEVSQAIADSSSEDSDRDTLEPIPSFDGLKSFSKFDEDLDLDNIPTIEFDDIDEPTLGTPAAPIPVAYHDPDFSFDTPIEDAPSDDEFNDLMDLNFDEVTEITLDGSTPIAQNDDPQPDPELEDASLGLYGSEDGDEAVFFTPDPEELLDDSTYGFLDDEAIAELKDEVTAELSDASFYLPEFQSETEVPPEVNHELISEPEALDGDRASETSQVFTGTPYGDSDQDTSGFFAAAMSTPKTPPTPISSFDGLRSFSNFDEDLDFNDIPIVELDDIPDFTLGMPTAPIPVVYLDPDFSFDKPIDETPKDDEFKELLDLNFDEVTEITLDGSNLIEEKDDLPSDPDELASDSEEDTTLPIASEELLDTSMDVFSTSIQSDDEFNVDLGNSGDEFNIDLGNVDFGIEAADVSHGSTHAVESQPDLLDTGIELSAEQETHIPEPDTSQSFKGAPNGDSDRDTSGFFSVPIPSPKAPPTIPSSPFDGLKSLANFDEDLDFEAISSFGFDDFDDEPTFGTPTPPVPVTYKESDFSFNISLHDASAEGLEDDLSHVNFDDVFDIKLDGSSTIAKKTNPNQEPKQTPNP